MYASHSCFTRPLERPTREKARNMAIRDSDAATAFEALACYMEELNTIHRAPDS
jgi:hypothetical protein